MRDFVPAGSAILLAAPLYVAGVLLHELGHAVPAALFGLRVCRLSVGRFGPRVFAIRLFNCTFELRLIPYGGATYLWPRTANHARAKFIVSTLCGPFVTLALALGSLALAIETKKSGSPDIGSITFAAVNALLLVQVLIPRRLTIDSWRTSTDIPLAWETWSLSDQELDDWLFHRYYWESGECKDHGDLDGAKRWLVQGLDERPNDPECLLLLGFVHCDLGQIEAARQILGRWLELSPIDPLRRPFVLNAIAWCDLCREGIDLAVAERYSSEAVAAMPRIREFEDTRRRIVAAIRKRSVRREPEAMAEIDREILGKSLG